MTGRIRWEDEPEGYAVTADGFIGPIGWRWRAFKIWNPDTRVDPRPFLTSDLPGRDRTQQHGTPDELKAEAERWLEQFVVSLGAVFPPEPAPDPDCPECGFGLPRHDKNCSQHPCSGSPWTCEYCAISCHFKHLGNGEPAKASQ